jgi:preprotein translocase subunit SecA
LTAESEPVARISVQDFVCKFDHLCGITATAWEDRHELRSVYGLSVERVATHQPSRRAVLDPVVCRSRDEKWGRIVDETRTILAQHRAVLIGTRTVARSEQLSELFRSSAIDHVVLNARNPKAEADIVAQAGRRGRVTIATNMAGRGTDIQLESDVAQAGGLHVIVSEPHAAARIDRQLIGRCARQGDPGTARVYASPDDEILVQAFGHQRAAQIRQASVSGASSRWLLARLQQSQRGVSRAHRAERARLTAHEANLAEAMQLLGLDPHLDPLPEA